MLKSSFGLLDNSYLDGHFRRPAAGSEDSTQDDSGDHSPPRKARANSLYFLNNPVGKLNSCAMAHMHV